LVAVQDRAEHDDLVDSDAVWSLGGDSFDPGVEVAQDGERCRRPWLNVELLPRGLLTGVAES
jgi:hypothetical protein